MQIFVVNKILYSFIELVVVCTIHSILRIQFDDNQFDEEISISLKFPFSIKMK